MEFLTLLNNNNDWLDYLMEWFDGDTALDSPKEFPCYVNFALLGWSDVDEEDEECTGEPLFYPHFLYLKDIKEMLENLED